MKHRLPQVKLAVEIALALAGGHVLLLALFRRYSLDGLGLPISARDPLPALIIAFTLLALRAWLNRQRSDVVPGFRQRLRPGRWFEGLGWPGVILGAALLFMWFLHHRYGGRLGNDGALLYIYVRSLVMDGDLNFANEFAEFVPSKFQYIAEQASALGTTPDPLYEPGPALLWAPWFLLAHGLVLLARALGSNVPANGYSDPYINAVCLGSLVWAFVAVVLSYRVCRKYFADWLAAIGVVILWLSSTLFWYTIFNPSMPHAVSTAAVSIFLYTWLRFREDFSTAALIAMGLSAGLMISMQRYNVFYLLAPLATFLGGLPNRLRGLERKTAKKLLIAVSCAGLAFVLTILPLILYNLFYSREGTLFRMGELGTDTLLFWRSPRIGEFLFSSNHGLFSWTPIAYLSVLGLLPLARKDRGLALALLMTLSGGVYLLSSNWDWYAGYSFGSRRLTEGFLLFALGFCALADWALRKPYLLGLVVISPIIVWNFLLSDQVRRGSTPQMGTFSFAEAAADGVREFYKIVGHPPSFPATWRFGRAYGLTPDRFDTIYGHRRYHNLSIDVGSEADAYFVGRGWSVPELLPDGRRFRWSLGNESSWLVPLFRPFDYRIRLTGEVSRHPVRQSLSFFVVVNGEHAHTVRWNVGEPSVELHVPARFWKEGLNEILFRYSWTVEAESVYGGADKRPIAVRLEVLELSIEK